MHRGVNISSYIISCLSIFCILSLSFVDGRSLEHAPGHGGAGTEEGLKTVDTHHSHASGRTLANIDPPQTSTAMKPHMDLTQLVSVESQQFHELKSPLGEPAAAIVTPRDGAYAMSMDQDTSIDGVGVRSLLQRKRRGGPRRRFPFCPRCTLKRCSSGVCTGRCRKQGKLFRCVARLTRTTQPADLGSTFIGTISGPPIAFLPNPLTVTAPPVSPVSFPVIANPSPVILIPPNASPVISTGSISATGQGSISFIVDVPDAGLVMVTPESTPAGLALGDIQVPDDALSIAPDIFTVTTPGLAAGQSFDTGSVSLPASLFGPFRRRLQDAPARSAGTTTSAQMQIVELPLIDAADLATDGLQSIDALIVTAGEPLIGCAIVHGRPSGCPFPGTPATGSAPTDSGQMGEILQSVCVTSESDDEEDFRRPTYRFGYCLCEIETGGVGRTITRQSAPCSSSAFALDSTDGLGVSAFNMTVSRNAGGETVTVFSDYGEPIDAHRPARTDSEVFLVSGQNVTVTIEFYTGLVLTADNTYEIEGDYEDYYAVDYEPEFDAAELGSFVFVPLVSSNASLANDTLLFWPEPNSTVLDIIDPGRP